jgi:hypothetical protein
MAWYNENRRERSGREADLTASKGTVFLSLSSPLSLLKLPLIGRGQLNGAIICPSAFW